MNKKVEGDEKQGDISRATLRVEKKCSYIYLYIDIHTHIYIKCQLHTDRFKLEGDKRCNFLIV